MTLLDQITAATAAQTPDPEAGNRARLERDAALAAAQGFSLPQTIYAVGTKLIDVGKNNARLQRAAFDKLPTLEDAAHDVLTRIADERRTDKVVQLSTLKLDPVTGRLQRSNGDSSKPGLLLTPTGWSQLVSWASNAPCYAAPYLAAIPPARRAAEWAAIVAQSADRPVVLRLRRPEPKTAPDTWELFSAVSERYNTTAGHAEVLSRLVDQFKGTGARAEIAYHGPGRMTVNVQGHTDVHPDDIRVGEVFKSGVRVSAADDRTGGIPVQCSLTRVRCVNLTVADALTAIWRGRHSASDLSEMLTDAIRRAGDRVGPFLAQWSKACQTELPRGIDAIEVLRAIAGDLPETRAAGVKVQPLVHVPSVEPIQLGEILVDAYRAEPSNTVAGISNALSRAPQVGAWPAPLDALELLAQAAGDVAREGIDALGVLELIREERTHRASN